MRLFYALTFTSDSIEQITTYQNSLSILSHNDSLVESGHFHLTLAFLGEVKSSRIKTLCDLIDSLVLDISPITVSGISTFHRRNDQVLWLAISPDKWLVELQQSLQTQLVRLGMPCENRPYVPHITLARHVPLTLPLEEFPFTEFKLNLRTIALMESCRNNNGLTYRPVKERFLRC